MLRGFHLCSYFVGLPLPPRSLLIRKNVTFSKTRRRCRHTNLVSTLGVTQCDPLPPLPPLKNPSYAPVLLFLVTLQYSQVFLRQTPLGTAPRVRLRDMSVL